MFQTNRAYLVQAQSRAAADLAAIQAEASAAEAALLATSLNTAVGTLHSAGQLPGDLYNTASDLATLAERERIAQARVDALGDALTAFDAAFV